MLCEQDMKSILILTLLSSSAFANGQCNQEKALVLAKEQLEKKYPQYKESEPYIAKSSGDNWLVHGTLPEWSLGGTPEALINKKSCEVLEVYATQ